MRLPFFIALRYLFAKKSHNVINIVSAISAAGMAVGTAALVVILSVYNGFDSMVRDMFSTVEPDYKLVSRNSRLFIPDSLTLDKLYNDEDVASFFCVLEQNLYMEYESKQGTALAMGVDDIYLTESGLADYMLEGELLVRDGGGRGHVVLGNSLAYEMGVNLSFPRSMTLYYPDPQARYSPLNPMASVNTLKLQPSGLFCVNERIDSRTILVDREMLSSLTGAGQNISSVNIYMKGEMGWAASRAFERRICQVFGPGFELLDRNRQNPAMYKVMRYEKAAVFLIMLLVVLVMGFSMFGSLSMLIEDKQRDIKILDSMGMPVKSIRRIFVTEGFLVTVSGILAGLVTGIVICLIQQKFALIKMPAGFVVDSYPVVIDPLDLCICVVVSSVISYLIALVPSNKILK